MYNCDGLIDGNNDDRYRAELDMGIGADRAALALGHGCPRLSSVDFIMTGIGVAGFMAIATRCPHLTHVSVCVLHDAAVIQLADSCPGLEVLVLDWAENVTDAAVDHLAGKCPKLRTLCIPYSAANAAIDRLRETHSGVVVSLVR